LAADFLFSRSTMPVTDVSSSLYDGRKVIFVVGLGMVGIGQSLIAAALSHDFQLIECPAFIEKLLNLDEEQKLYIVTAGEEPHFAYNRVRASISSPFCRRTLTLVAQVGLTEYFQHRSVADLYLQTPSWYAEHAPSRFTFHLGEQVISIDTQGHRIFTDQGHAYQYDVCVLATGSGAGLPPYVSMERKTKTKGVFVYRSIADLDEIMAYSKSPNVTRAAVVGGGLLGLEAAKAVYDLPSLVLSDLKFAHKQARLL
jgi:nitrite reductase (NAD(P)H)